MSNDTLVVSTMFIVTVSESSRIMKVISLAGLPVETDVDCSPSQLFVAEQVPDVAVLALLSNESSLMTTGTSEHVFWEIKVMANKFHCSYSNDNLHVFWQLGFVDVRHFLDYFQRLLVSVLHVQPARAFWHHPAQNKDDVTNAVFTSKLYIRRHTPFAAS